ncbi:HipA N-terminal domain-containing protein [Bradyrhizobium sp. CCBAU 45394]|uniref:HipA N-terminal domain-containing protein n=1 Tax=Bradyrhizobium sp. CCBAU 45394 TaxID=1325087 RepID=UPI002302BDB8|nr:HipA N-terminal domain-containing protein [Bradyrhizobium sp. CCBAU 45394]
MAELIALLGGTEVGRVRSDSRGRLTFVYDNAWRNAEGAYPLSLSPPRSTVQPLFSPSCGGCFLTTSRCSSAGPRNFRYRRATCLPSSLTSVRIAPGPSSSSRLIDWRL